MQIKVRLIGAFRVGRFKEEVCQYPAETTVQEVVTALQLPKQILGAVLINGMHAEFESVLCDGDCLSLLPLLDGG